MGSPEEVPRSNHNPMVNNHYSEHLFLKLIFNYTMDKLLAGLVSALGVSLTWVLGLLCESK